MWPLAASGIQSAFFLSLASSCLTLFGLVFTLCLIGTQLMATRTNIAVRRVFGLITWLYLVMFIATTLWTLALSYRAGQPPTSPNVCIRPFRAGFCIKQTLAGRIGIFGITYSLVLLLPFIAYIYRRLTLSYIFSSMAGSVLRARTTDSAARRCNNIGTEIIAAAGDANALKEGLNNLLQLGVAGARRRTFLRGVDNLTIANQVSGQFANVNNRLFRDPALAGSIVETMKIWAVWLTSYRKDAPGPANKPHHLIELLTRCLPTARTTASGKRSPSGLRVGPLAIR
jgi:hypothetical protein